jgi:polysaccharide pyruvyl transferase WcaK-like protein
MLIEIRKAGFKNKGAELMQRAILDKVDSLYPDARIAMAPSSASATFEQRVRMGFYQKAWHWKYGRQWGQLASLVPKKLREMYGVVLDKEVDFVLDASGFSYSDQWGVSNSVELAVASNGWKKRGTPCVLLPQAFGPFTTRKIRDAMIRATNNIDLIYARDERSYEFLISVVGRRDNVKIAPDFTNLMAGQVPAYFNREEHKFCVVPNYRMIDKTSQIASGQYIPFLVAAVRHLLDRNAKPFILIHEGSDDHSIAKAVVDAVGEVPIITEPDPLYIKGILGECEGTIGSRFHGLVSALSQGVPALATGWSHKYEMLFKDYEFDEGILNIQDLDDAREKIDMILDLDYSEAIRAKLKAQSESLKAQSEKMWNEVFSLIDERCRSR